MRRRGLSNLRSFRMRIALLSVAVSAAALVVFGGLTYAAVHRLTVQRMDEYIREAAHRFLVQPTGAGHWVRAEESTRYFLGLGEENTFFMIVKGRDRSVLYASADVPAGLADSEIPAPDDWGTYAPHDSSTERVPPRGDLPGPAPGGRFMPPPGAAIPLKLPEFTTRDAGGIKWRTGMMGTPEVTLVIGLNMKRVTAEMAQVRNALLAMLPIVLALVALGSWWLSQRALKPIADLTDTIRRVKAQGLDQRVANEDLDREFSDLVAVFNDMMDWIETSFRQAIRFSADASHELKTPLTVLQVQLERAMNEAQPGSAEQQRYEAFAKELQRLKSITKKLLLLSRIDAGELKPNLRPMDISELVEGVVEDIEALAPHLNVQGRIDADLWVMADADLMKQVVQNLAANAAKYNVKGGFVRVGLQADDRTVRLAIANSGKGIPPEDRDKVFTRFYRGDRARSRRVKGAGLGLSLAREIVRAHDGDLLLEETTDGTTLFAMRLPRAAGQTGGATDAR